MQIHPLRNVGADTFIHALNDGIHRNQTEIQMQKLADRLTQLEDAMRQIGSTKRGDTITHNGYSIRVESVRENRIEAVRIRERRAAA